MRCSSPYVAVASTRPFPSALSPVSKTPTTPTTPGFVSLCRQGVLHLVDLAGSERLDRSGAGNDAQRLRETQAINKSLSCLADVFSALSAKASHVPFRNSKLTYLMQVCVCAWVLCARWLNGVGCACAGGVLFSGASPLSSLLWTECKKRLVVWLVFAWGSVSFPVFGWANFMPEAPRRRNLTGLTREKVTIDGDRPENRAFVSCTCPCYEVCGAPLYAQRTRQGTGSYTPCAGMWPFGASLLWFRTTPPNQSHPSPCNRLAFFPVMARPCCRFFRPSGAWRSFVLFLSS